MNAKEQDGIDRFWPALLHKITSRKIWTQVIAPWAWPGRSPSWLTSEKTHKLVVFPCLIIMIAILGNDSINQSVLHNLTTIIPFTSYLIQIFQLKIRTLGSELNELASKGFHLPRSCNNTEEFWRKSWRYQRTQKFIMPWPVHLSLGDFWSPYQWHICPSESPASDIITCHNTHDSNNEEPECPLLEP